MVAEAEEAPRTAQNRCKVFMVGKEMKRVAVDSRKEDVGFRIERRHYHGNRDCIYDL